MGKERLLPILAIGILLLASGSTLYVYATQTDTSHITINHQEYTLDQLFLMTTPRTFDDLEYSGIALDNLIQKIGITNPETHEYTLISSDGYQKTVTWENMQHGLLTEKGMSVFSDLPKAFRVKDIIEIEVK
jgi:hypothetical protein